MKAKKKTKNTATWSELREMVMAYETHEYRIKLLEQKVEDLERLVYKDAEVIDLDKAEELKGVDDSEEVEFTEEELNFLKNVIIATPTRDDETGHYLGRIYHKLNKMLKESHEDNQTR